jgi:hypothetical protein
LAADRNQVTSWAGSRQAASREDAGGRGATYSSDDLKRTGLNLGKMGMKIRA